MATPVEQIKERLSIVDVVSTYIKIEKAGSQYKARCPFHNEKTPSFYISPDRNSFHCFGCNVGGDIFTFVEKIEGLEFKDTLKMLADRAGVTLTAGENKSDSELFDVLEAATQYFESVLDQSADALQYVLDRGITEETKKLFRIGFAKNEWRQLTGFLMSKGFNEESIEKVGLSIKTEKGYYDRFRGRVMFPICNPSGKVVGFSGRILPSLVDSQPNAGKYVNSPETELYHKSRILFGYDKAKRAMNENTGCVLVEGQMDLVLAHQAGTKNAVAVSGTALTIDHLNLIKRFTSKLVLSLDADVAGFNAAKKSAELALLAQMDVRAISLEGGKDPADMIRADALSWKKSVENALPIVEYMMNIIRNLYPDDRTFGLQVTTQVLPLLVYIQNKIDQAFFVRLIAGKLKVPEESVWQQLAKVHMQVTAPVQKSDTQGVQKEAKIVIIIKTLIGMREVAKEHKDEIDTALAFTKTKLPEYTSVIEPPEEMIGSYVMKVAKEHEHKTEFKDNITELILSLEEETISLLSAKVNQLLKESETNDDEKETAKLLSEFQVLQTSKHSLIDKRKHSGPPPK